MRRTLDRGLIAELRREITGSVLDPDDGRYDAARALHNGLIDRRPALIVRCQTTHDVVAALAFANRVGVEVSVRGGGHNVAGRAVTDNGVMIDLSAMKSVTVDASSATACVDAGVVWGELNAAAAEHGLAVTGGVVSTIGIAGLTLGGGLGWLMAKHGLAADNLLSAVVVTAEGDVLRADATSHPDLFWGLRGGGGNFGVVTSFTYRLHPVEMVVGGLIAHPLDAAQELLRFYREAVTGASDDLTVFAALVHARDGSGTKLAALIVFHTGDAETAARDLEPFKSWGTPLVVEVGSMPYPVMNTILDAAFPDGGLNYWLSSFTRGATRWSHRHGGGALRTRAVAAVDDPPRALPRSSHPGCADIDRSASSSSGLESGHSVGLDRPAHDLSQHRMGARDVRGSAAASPRRPLAQLPRRRPVGRRCPRGLRTEHRAPPRRETALRPQQRLSPQSQHRAVARTPPSWARRAAQNRKSRG